MLVGDNGGVSELQKMLHPEEEVPPINADRAPQFSTRGQVSVSGALRALWLVVAEHVMLTFGIVMECLGLRLHSGRHSGIYCIVMLDQQLVRLPTIKARERVAWEEGVVLDHTSYRNLRASSSYRDSELRIELWQKCNESTTHMLGVVRVWLSTIVRQKSVDAVRFCSDGTNGESEATKKGCTRRVLTPVQVYDLEGSGSTGESGRVHLKLMYTTIYVRELCLANGKWR